MPRRDRYRESAARVDEKATAARSTAPGFITRMPAISSFDVAAERSGVAQVKTASVVK